jgi:hypothetical protein
LAKYKVTYADGSTGIVEEPDPEEDSGGLSEALLNIGKEAAIPTALSLALSPFPGGAMIGGAGGEGINQLLGITPKSASQIALAGVLPPAFKLAGRGLKGLASLFGRKGSALVGDAMGRQVGKDIGAFTRPGPSASSLYGQVDAIKTPIPLSKTAPAIDEGVAALSGLSTPPTADINKLANLKALIGKQGLTPRDAQNELRLLTETTSPLIERHPISGQKTKAAFEALRGDVESAAEAGDEGAILLRDARAKYSREQGEKALKESVDDATRTYRGSGGLERLNAPRVLQGLKKNKEFENSFSKEEIEQIEALLERFNDIPTATGENQLTSKLLAASLFGGGAVTGNVGMGAAGLGALAAPSVIRTGKNIVSAASFPEGRKLFLPDAKGMQWLSKLIAGASRPAVRQANANK